MKYLSLLLRGLGFWLGVFYAFTLGWGSLKLNSIPDVLAPVAMVAPLVGLFVGSILPDKGIQSGVGARNLYVAVLLLGVAGAVVVAMDDLKFAQGPNMPGFWFQIAIAVASALLLLRIVFAREPTEE